MSSGSLKPDRLRPTQEAQSRESVEAWVRRDLNARYDWVAAEMLPDILLRLLPQE